MPVGFTATLGISRSNTYLAMPRLKVNKIELSQQKRVFGLYDIIDGVNSNFGPLSTSMSKIALSTVSQGRTPHCMPRVKSRP